MARKSRPFMMGIALSVVALTIVCLQLAEARGGSEQHGSTEDRRLSPYFFVKSEDPDTDPLPLKHTEADVRISGVIAHVTITQVYKNEGKNTLEAVYVFPASTRAAVHAMRMTIGERVIEAEIMERQEARQAYERAKQEGRTASLLEQQRPNVFQMNVANILPGDEIKTELQYTELLEAEDQLYELVFPTVVGPRYSSTPAASATDFEKWVENPYLHSGEPAPYSFDLKLEIQSGIPISQLASPSHDITVEYAGKTRAHVALKDNSKAATKDFVLRYKLAGGQIQAGMLLYPGPDENFFLLLMEPPARVEAEAVLPREYIFIVDVSGSMHGFPIEVSKALMKNIITDLRPADFMNVLLFAGGSAVLSEGSSLPATEDNKNKAIDWINAQRGGGGTNILPALRRALALPRTEGVSRSVVVVTDGYVSVEPQVFEMIRDNLDQANLFAFGIGKSVNRFIIEGMSRVGRGEPFVVLDQNEAPKRAAMFRQYIDSPVLTDIDVTFQGLQAYDVEPAAVPDLFALRPIVVFGKYRGTPSGEVVVRGKSGSGAFKKVILVNENMASSDNAALRLLWARHRIMRLSDLNHLREDDRRVDEVTALGLKYSLMTSYTSFVAVDKIKRADGEIVTVKQPLPLPEGVSDLAVGDHGHQVGAAAPLYMTTPALESHKMLQRPLPGMAGEPRGRRDELRTNLRNKEQTVKGVLFDLNVEKVRGDADRASIEKALEAHHKAMLSCCLKALKNQPHMQGEIIYDLLINPDGTVKEIKLVSSSAASSSMIDCLKKVLQKLHVLPPPQGTAEITLKVSCGLNR